MDAAAFARGVDEAALMLRAAGQLARGVLAEGGRGYGLRVGWLAGAGNNGGDGLAAAGLLARRGVASHVCVLGGAGALRGVPALMRDRLAGTGVRLVDTPAAALAGADVVVDCLLGTGASGPLRPATAEAAGLLTAAPAPVVACDLPTGVDGHTGAVQPGAVQASRTVTLGAGKVGLWLAPARGQTGRRVIADLGLITPQDIPAAWVLEDADAAAALPPPGTDAHKHSRGGVLLLAGAPGMAGAAVLAARGALAGGAGLVTVATAASVRDTVAAAVPEALTVALPADPADARSALAGPLARADALVIGPGLGRAATTDALAAGLLADVALPVVVDADGIGILAEHPELQGAHASPARVLTPHAGEFARLAPGQDWTGRIDGGVRQAQAWGSTLVLKGPGTLTVTPGGTRWVNDSGSAALATGGTGDVLAGLLGAALAADPTGPRTVPAVVHLHGRAGEHAAAAADPRTVTAGAVAAAVGPALAGLRRRAAERGTA